MTTVNGPTALNSTCSITFLDFHTGLRRSMVVVRHDNQKIVEFMIKNQEYYLGLDWKILQPGGFIKAGDLLDKKIEFIYDKFNRKHFLQNVRANNGNLGRPEEPGGITFFDKSLVIQID